MGRRSQWAMGERTPDGGRQVVKLRHGVHCPHCPSPWAYLWGLADKDGNVHKILGTACTRACLQKNVLDKR